MRAVNLIPADQRSGGSVGSGRSGGAAYAVLGVCAGLAVMALLYGLARHEVSSRQGEAASLTAKAQQAQAAAAQLAPFTNFVALKAQRTQAVETLVDSRFDWAHAMHEFGRVLPAGVSLLSLGGNVGSASGTSASTTPTSSSTVASSTPPGSVPTFALTGCAWSQTAVARMLERLRLIDGVTSVTLQNSTKTVGVGSSTASGSSGGGCAGNEPAFSVAVAFQPLPAANAVAAASTTRATPAAASPSSGVRENTSAGAPR
jgi:Tfp pilus assembly protein PilN